MSFHYPPSACRSAPRSSSGGRGYYPRHRDGRVDEIEVPSVAPSYRGKVTDQRETVHLLRVKEFEDGIGPINSVMPEKTHKESAAKWRPLFLLSLRRSITTSQP